MVRVTDARKRFGPVRAVDGVSLSVEPREIRGVLGENGAGKSTLMGMIAGTVVPDDGTIEVDSQPLPHGDPEAAISAGIAMVHQHSKLVGAFTVAENVALTRLRHGSLLDVRAAGRRLSELADEFGLSVHPQARVEDIPVAERQRAEILRAVLQDPKVLILDEPTALLAPHERERVMALARRLAEGGCAVIFLTHHLEEVTVICDSVTVMRKGTEVFTKKVETTNLQELAEAMVGRQIGADLGAIRVDHTPQDTAAIRLSIKDLTVASVDGSRAELEDFSLSMRAGELVGIVGVDGNGQDALMGALSGIRPHAGEIVVGDAPLPEGDPTARIKNGIARIPGDRHAEGLALGLPVWENLLLGRRASWGLENRFGFLARRKARAIASDLVEKFDIRVPDIDVEARTASGGNQQKIILARELSSSPSIIIAMNPTRGLDIGSTQFVHSQLVSAAESEATVLLITSDLDEALRLTHRILVLSRGRVTGNYAREFDRYTIGLAMGGRDVAA